LGNLKPFNYAFGFALLAVVTAYVPHDALTQFYLLEAHATERGSKGISHPLRNGAETTKGSATPSAKWEWTPELVGSAIALTFLSACFAAIAYQSARILWRTRARRRLLGKVNAVINQQVASLVRRRAQLVKLDAYGKPQMEKWIREVDYFIMNHIAPSLTPMEQGILARERAAITNLLASRVEAATQAQPAFQAFCDDMTPAEFEVFCAEELRRGGWDARVTMQSRDQGVDVVAEKDGARVVLQCKLYARPVGNKSVQEVAAARAHEHANYGVVVTNNGYTLAAEQLATTNGVLLLHYLDLRNLDDILRPECGLKEGRSN
jgi:restriction system protein